MNSNIEKSDKTSFVKISEQPSLYSDLEKKSVREILEDINTEDQKVALAVQKAIPQIEKLVTQIVPRMKQGGRIFYMGAGTSGRLGVLDASEIPPTFGMPPTLIIGLIAGPEYVTGSSRMKSGTGQKMILNMITTSVMIQLGRVKGNKMVNMQLSNQKLVDRGTRMIVEELGLEYEKAKALLLMHGSVKKAVDAYKAG